MKTKTFYFPGVVVTITQKNAHSCNWVVFAEEHIVQCGWGNSNNETDFLTMKEAKKHFQDYQEYDT